MDFEPLSQFAGLFYLDGFLFGTHKQNTSFLPQRYKKNGDY